MQFPLFELTWKTVLPGKHSAQFWPFQYWQGSIPKVAKNLSYPANLFFPSPGGGEWKGYRLQFKMFVFTSHLQSYWESTKFLQTKFIIYEKFTTKKIP